MRTLVNVLGNPEEAQVAIRLFFMVGLVTKLNMYDLETILLLFLRFLCL